LERENAPHDELQAAPEVQGELRLGGEANVAHTGVADAEVDVVKEGDLRQVGDRILELLGEPSLFGLGRCGGDGR
jgi:hypothetical protein